MTMPERRNLLWWIICRIIKWPMFFISVGAMVVCISVLALYDVIDPPLERPRTPFFPINEIKDMADNFNRKSDE